MAKKPTTPSQPTRKLVELHMLSPFAQARLAQKALEVSRRNGKEGPHYFVGHTGDDKGEGIALCESDKDGKLTRHWGTEQELMDILSA